MPAARQPGDVSVRPLERQQQRKQSLRCLANAQRAACLAAARLAADDDEAALGDDHLERTKHALHPNRAEERGHRDAQPLCIALGRSLEPQHGAAQPQPHSQARQRQRQVKQRTRSRGRRHHTSTNHRRTQAAQRRLEEGQVWPTRERAERHRHPQPVAAGRRLVVVETNHVDPRAVLQRECGRHHSTRRRIGSGL